MPNKERIPFSPHPSPPLAPPLPTSPPFFLPQGALIRLLAGRSGSAYLHFELILGDFAPALVEVSFGMIFRNPLETNHPKKCLAKH